jgi:hypothetical protein
MTSDSNNATACDKKINLIFEKAFRRYSHIYRTRRGKRTYGKLAELFCETPDLDSLNTLARQIESQSANDKDLGYFLKACVDPLETAFEGLAESENVDFFRFRTGSGNLYLTSKIKGIKQITPGEKQYIELAHSVHTSGIKWRDIKKTTGKLIKALEKREEKEKPVYHKICRCGNEFTTTNGGKLYCTDACRKAANRTGVRVRAYTINSQKEKLPLTDARAAPPESS